MKLSSSTLLRFIVFMFWMANALDWNAKPIVLQTFASSTFHGVSRVVDDRLTAFCFEQFMSCNFRHLVTTTHGNLTSVFFLGNGCNDVATMLKFCKALSDLVNLLILRSSGFYAKWKSGVFYRKHEKINQKSSPWRRVLHEPLTLRTQEILWYW